MALCSHSITCRPYRSCIARDGHPIYNNVQRDVAASRLSHLLEYGVAPSLYSLNMSCNSLHPQSPQYFYSLLSPATLKDTPPTRSPCYRYEQLKHRGTAGEGKIRTIFGRCRLRDSSSLVADSSHQHKTPSVFCEQYQPIWIPSQQSGLLPTFSIHSCRWRCRPHGAGSI
jgi:hypothetical protein